MQGADILIVDDDFDIREVLGVVLEQQGYGVLSASDGADALRVLREATPCPRMIFLDLRMPVMNGWQFLEALEHEPHCAGVPIVVITADRSEAAHSVRGVAGFLAKPISLSDILGAVARFVG